jgi:hypothetical protein
MKRIIKLFSVSFLLILILQVQLNTVAAQGPPDNPGNSGQNGPPNPPPGNPGCPPDCPGNPNCPPRCVPIDGGLSLLIAAGIGIGAKKAYDKRKAAERKNREMGV